MINELIAFVERGIPISLDAARDKILQAMVRYVMLPDPDHMLLVKAPPGVGKSHQAVRVAESQKHKRVLYAGPRHDWFATLQGMSQRPADWFPWQPRQMGDPETGFGETCKHEPYMSTWLGRGHRSMKFCEQICGWNYINKECPYHQQKRLAGHLVYGMHQHVFLNHPLQFHLVIGDESPLSAALHRWLIPGEHILPGGYDPFHKSDAQDLLACLQNLTILGAHNGGKPLAGKALLDALGGADLIREAIAGIAIPANSDFLLPKIRSPEQAEETPYGHFFALMRLLQRESEAVIQGHEEYLERVIVEKGKLMLLLRRKVNSRMPKHMIWLDATGNADMYKGIFEREVRMVEPVVEPAKDAKIFQVLDRANGKMSLLEEGAPTVKAEQARQLIAALVERYGYQRVGVFTFKDLEAVFDVYETGHFGAETGSNLFEGVDALFVLGTPLPRHTDLRAITKMIFFERMNPLQEGWSQKSKPYSHDFKRENVRVGGYWSDPDLQSVVWQHREARVIQAAHRARINVREGVHVWLFTNLPIDELRPNEVFSVAELLGAPENVNVYMWLKFIEVGISMCLENERLHGERNVIRREMSGRKDEMGISERTLATYWREAQKMFKEESVQSLDFTRLAKTGRPPKALDFTQKKAK
jgi:hypothetical protein